MVGFPLERRVSSDHLTIKTVKFWSGLWPIHSSLSDQVLFLSDAEPGVEE